MDQRWSFLLLQTKTDFSVPKFNHVLSWIAQKCYHLQHVKQSKYSTTHYLYTACFRVLQLWPLHWQNYQTGTCGYAERWWSICFSEQFMCNKLMNEWITLFNGSKTHYSRGMNNLWPSYKTNATYWRTWLYDHNWKVLLLQRGKTTGFSTINWENRTILFDDFLSTFCLAQKLQMIPFKSELKIL